MISPSDSAAWIFFNVLSDSSGDVERRNAIASLLQDWELLKILEPKQAEQKASLSQIKVVSYKEKDQWELVPKYNIGKKIK